MDSTWTYAWPTETHDTVNDSQHLGWYRYSECVPTMPTMAEEPTAIQEVSHAEQNPWSIVECQPHPMARYVRYVQPGTRAPIDVDSTARQIDLDRAQQPLQAHEVRYEQPNRETEAIRLSESQYQSGRTEVFCNSKPA